MGRTVKDSSALTLLQPSRVFFSIAMHGLGFDVHESGTDVFCNCNSRRYRRWNTMPDVTNLSHKRGGT